MCTTCVSTVSQSASMAPVLVISASAATATAITSIRRRLSSTEDEAPADPGQDHEPLSG